MADNLQKSPGVYETETDLSQPAPNVVIGVPAGLIGTADKGPAFVPVSVSSFDQFKQVFGNVNSKHPAVYGASEFLKHRQSLTFCKVLNAGANASDGDILTSATTGRDLSAGFHLDGNVAVHDTRRHTGAVQFLVAKHSLQTNEAVGMPLFTDNNSFNGSSVSLVRGMVLMASGSRLMVMNGDESAVGAFTAGGPDDAAELSGLKFKLVISSTLGNEFYNTDGNVGVKILTASLNPTDQDYFGKILNTNPDKFASEQHLLYADFAVDDELASAQYVGVLSGSANTSTTSGDSSLVFRKAFGAFDTSFKSPSTTYFISQPFGQTEYDLFKFEALDDGAYASKLYKISIANVKASLSDADQYGSFTVQIRDWNDTDTNPIILEQFSNCSLDPNSENYVAKLIGDRKVFYNFDATIESERRLVATGKYSNKSKFVRVTMADAVDRKLVPATSIPFGFRGAEIINTNSLLTDTASTTPRIGGILPTLSASLSGSILPPVPFRVKVTRGEVASTGLWQGQPGSTEVASAQFYWGVKFERNTLPLNANVTTEKNTLLEAYTKFLGIKKLDVLVTGSGADSLNNNKFSLANVAFSNASVSDLTASINTHMREAAYIRNARIDPTTYKISDSALGNRMSFATLLAQGEPAEFNRFSSFTKFTNFMQGGWDGTNILDRDANRMNDKASSFDDGGGAATGYVSPGLLVNAAGEGSDNSTVVSYMTAIKIMTDSLTTNANILAVPSIRESFITDYAMTRAKDYGLALYVMDIPSYNDDLERLFDDSTGKPSVEPTANAVDSRAIDNNYTAVYYPDIFLDDPANKKKVRMPASVAALGALAFNDRIAYPWFAPAGFNRAALDSVSNVTIRLNVSDRDRLQESRVNPIATFPKLGFVIYGQKTMQVDKTALDRVNVRRLMLEVKRIITSIANRMVFEQNDDNTRNKFVSDATSQLALIGVQQGVQKFKVVCNETNNTSEDVNLNRINARIVVIPTKSFEIISLDFVITNSGVEFG